MTQEIIERDVTKEELARMKVGFEEHALEHGIPPYTQKRLGFVAMDDGRFVGCSSGLTDHNWFHLTDLWLEKDCRGQGLGKKLLRSLEGLVVSEGISRIYTWTAGYEAPEFYKSQGYEVFAEFEDYFPTGHSRVGLKKDLP